VVANKKLYVNREEGFIGTAMRKDEFVCDCSDIDDIIIFRENGVMQVVKIDNKVFVGKGIIYCAVFKKKDERTIYNMIYKDGNSGNTMMKRFPVTSITRGKDYKITKSEVGSKVLYLTANANGEAEIVTVNLRKSKKLKVLKIDINFANLTIKGKAAGGNIVTKHRVQKIELKSEGVSTLSARKIWFDDNVQRINVEERGDFLGEFSAQDQILTINQKAIIELKSFDISNHFDDDMIIIEKLNARKAVSAIYFDGTKNNYFVKRFLIEHNTNKFNFITEHKDSFLELVSTDWHPRVELIFVKEKGKERKTEIIHLEEFIAIKGIKAIGNRLSSKKIKEINLLEPLAYTEPVEEAKKTEKIETITNEIVINKEIELTITNNKSDKDDPEGQITLEL
jgi:topoisomerase IV subunit A